VMIKQQKSCYKTVLLHYSASRANPTENKFSFRGPTHALTQLISITLSHGNLFTVWTDSTRCGWRVQLKARLIVRHGRRTHVLRTTRYTSIYFHKPCTHTNKHTSISTHRYSVHFSVIAILQVACVQRHWTSSSRCV